MNSSYFGIVAAICTTIAFVPQVIQILKTKDTTAISLPMYLIFSFGVFMWLCYGWYLNDLPMIIANSITLILSLIVLFYKIKDVFNNP